MARDLPRRLREEVTGRLAPGESLLWVDRPTPRDYFLYAPLDLLSAPSDRCCPFTPVVCCPLVHAGCTTDDPLDHDCGICATPSPARYLR